MGVAEMWAPPLPQEHTVHSSYCCCHRKSRAHSTEPRNFKPGPRGRPASSRSKLTAKSRGGDYSFKMRQKRQQSWVFL